MEFPMLMKKFLVKRSKISRLVAESENKGDRLTRKKELLGVFKAMHQVYSVFLISSLWLCSSLFAQPMNLSPDFQAKFFLRKAKNMIKHRNWAGVARALGKYDTLLEKYDRNEVSKPDDFYFHYAYSLCEIKKYTGCFEKATRYLKEDGDNAPFAGHAREMIRDFVSTRLSIAPRWTYIKSEDCTISYNSMNNDSMTLYARPDQICTVKFSKQGYEPQEHILTMAQTSDFKVTLEKSPRAIEKSNVTTPPEPIESPK